MSTIRERRERRTHDTTQRWVEVEHRGKVSSYTHFDCLQRAKHGGEAFQRWFYRAMATRTIWHDEPDMNEYELGELRRVLSRVREYVEHAEGALDRLEGVDRRSERIRQLREVAGRTPAEAAAYLAKADELEAAG